MSKPMFSMKTVGWAVLIFALLAIPAFPQSSTGRVVGVVTDPGGAVVTGAKVTVKNVDTGITVESITGPDGRYQVLQLPVGKYTVGVQQSGFESALTPPNELDINQTLRVDVHLALGAVSQTVAVEATAAQVETENVTVGGTVTGAAVQGLCPSQWARPDEPVANPTRGVRRGRIRHRRKYRGRPRR